ncbi:MAG: hypothetical protein JSW72_04970 [Candidatus Bathyarchaeota archaeon]|nr:MAG: hypothetical protein JSW72_04970 [Candidatus Bathyarchaeota archaeon]
MVVISRITRSEDFRQFLKKLGIRGEIFVVKPDWMNASAFTSAETLDSLFSALNGRIKVIDGYSAWRNELNTGSRPKEVITPNNAKAKWRWIKEQDAWFLRFSGIDQVLVRHDAEYINVTEEVWSGRTLEADEVRDYVDSKFGVLVRQKMYGFVPTRIYELKGSTLLSLSSSFRNRDQISLSTKNLFSLIPNPARYAVHGTNERRSSQSIVDINKIYRSFFSPCYWINEIKELGILVGSKNSLETDVVSAELLGLDHEKIGYLRHATNVFGGYNKKVLENLPSAF